MKVKLKYLIFLAVTLTAVGCVENIEMVNLPSRDNINPFFLNSNPELFRQLSEQEKEVILMLGFENSITSLTQNKIIIEGDMSINRNTKIISDVIRSKDEKLNILYPDEQTHMGACGFPFTYTGIIEHDNFPLSYWIDPDFGVVMRQAIQDGFNDWTAITNLENFFETPNRNQADIEVNLNNGLGFPGRADFPLNGLPGDIELSENDFISGLRPDSYRRVVSHEIGHAIGFRHSDADDFCEEDDDYVTLHGTPRIDRNSMMSSGSTATFDPVTGLFVANDFNDDDIWGARQVYPLFHRPYENLIIQGRKTKTGISLTLNANYQDDAPYYKAEICVLERRMFGGNRQQCATRVIPEGVNIYHTFSLGSNTLPSTYEVTVTPLNYLGDFEGIPETASF